MANINNIRAVFTLDDKFTSPLKNINSAMQGYTNKLQRLGSNRGITSLNRQMNTLNGTMITIQHNGESAFRTLTKFSGLYKALGTIGNVFSGAFGGVFDYAKSFETNAIGISGILTSMVNLEGKTLEWNNSMLISKDIMRKLRIEALQTAATSSDLIDTFRALLGPGLGAGMTIDEIMKFTTVGVNAVKSMGLPTNQYIQELRGLEQGGIRASSSTLATALGLKDKDINEAKASSEGLFKFLMKRMEGFKYSTVETANTMAGQYEIAKEAILSVGVAAGENVFKTYSKTLGELNNVLLKKNKDSGLFEINPEIVGTMKTFADTLDFIVSKSIDLGERFYENFEFVGKSLVSLFLFPKVLELIGNLTSGIHNRVASSVDILTKEENITERIKQETSSRLSELNKEFALKELIIKQNEKIEEKISAYSKKYKGNNELSKYHSAVSFEIKEHQKSLERLGYSQDKINNLTFEYLNIMEKTKSKNQEVSKAAKDLKNQIDKEISSLIKEKEVLENNINNKNKYVSAIQNGIGVMGNFTGALSGVAFALMSVTDSQDTTFQSLANGLFVVDATVMAAGQLSNAISSLTEWWGGLELAVKSAYGTMAVGVGLFAVVGAAVYKGYQDLERYKKRGLGGFKIEGDEVVWTEDNPLDLYNPEDTYGRDGIVDGFAVPDYQKGISLKFPKGNEGASSSKASGGGKKGKSPQEIANEYKELITTIRNTTESLNENQTAYDKTMNSAEKQIDTWTKKLDKLNESGLLSEEDYNNAKQRMTSYYSEMIAKAQDAQDKQNLNLIKAKTEQARLTMELNRGGQEEEYKLIDENLQNHKEYLEKMLENTSLNIEERIELEKEYANVVKSIRENNMYDFKSSWKATLEDLSMQQINYGDSIKSVFSTIQTSGETLLTSTESFGTKIKTFFSDVASSILAEMAKIIMKGLITNAILSIFNFGGKSVSSGISTNYNIGESNFFTGLDYHAKGGIASGWSIVGEQGPELVNFSNPARVYTSQQTSNALSQNGNGNLNIKFDIKNETGTKVEAEQTGSSFDGESYVIGVVLKAISTNKNGMRSILKGVAAT